MAEKRKFQEVSSVSSEDESIDSSEDEHSSLYMGFDEISEEDLSSEASNQPKTDINKPLCDPCFLDKLIRVVASYMCYVCGKRYCNNCFSVHDKSHGFICFESESGKLDGEIAEYVSFMMNESDDESEKRLMENDVCDYVDIKHRLDKVGECAVFGLTGYANKWWVACDYSNYCIKIFSLCSNVLQRYIRLGSQPWDVTEIIVENKTTEQDSASCSETTISGTDNKPDRKHMLAVTFRWPSHLLIIDLGKNPAVIHSKIKMEKECLSIDFYDGNLYIACDETSREPSRSVSIMSVEGVTLKTFQPDLPFNNWHPYFTVLNGNIYMTENLNHRVVCYNDEGRVLHEITIDSTWPHGICVDRSEDKVYICTVGHNKVYELKSDLSRYKQVLDRTTRFMEGPYAISFYSDKLYVGHWPGSHVTVVRLL